MFKGTYHHRIDGKGRVPVPSGFRRLLEKQGAQGVVATPLDQCIAVYPPGEWAKLEAQLVALPPFSKAAKALTRRLASQASECPIDVQGRILLAPALRQTAGLGQEAVIIGVLDRFEIWDPGNWTTFLRETESLLDDVTLETAWPLPRNSPPSTREP